MYCQSGNGGAGTSYSGGGGGGAVYSYNSGGSVVAGSASGVRGGNAASFDSRYDATGGVGTPNGGSAGGATLLTSGTGGLLIIYCDGELNIAYNSVIDSQGVRNTIGTSGITGGSSGGGSVNIFHVAKLTNNGTVTSTGGATGNGSVLGGAGGNGTVTLQQVTLKQNQVRFLNEDSKPIGQMDLGYAIQGAYGKVAKFTAESVYLLPIKTLKLSWKHAHDSVTTEPILEFSKTLDPFVPENPLIFTETLGYRERVEFYVRAKSGEMQTEQGRFEITAEIEGA
ncbi:hypothetical protein [Metabacillus fastidiosus]|uniref:hypothetical protein n=1 Tax=Metabacillus fastidiosus TaxID=1458 RepID=UPI003D27F515